MEVKQAGIIRRRLAEAGITESELAARVGISHVYLGDILRGARIGAPVQTRIQEALDELLRERGQARRG